MDSTLQSLSRTNKYIKPFPSSKKMIVKAKDMNYLDINLCELRQYCRLFAVLECGNALLATNPGLAKALQPQGDLMIPSDDGTRV